MQYCFVGMLIVAWILAWFDFDALFIKGLNEVANLEITKAGYYFLFLAMGLLFDLILVLKHK